MTDADVDGDDDRVDAYDYLLPPDRIAQHPADRRDDSRLLVLEPGAAPAHGVFRDLARNLRPGDLLVRNDTRVFPARLIGRRPGGGRVELLLLRPETPSGSPPEGEAPESADWLALAKRAARLRPGMVLDFGDGALRATVGVREGDQARGEIRVRLAAASRAPGEEGGVMPVIERIGCTPLPPYIRRPGGVADARDRERYQTIYAGPAGAAAAPTAGLHFTPEVDARLAERGVGLATLTLHTGLGTFRPMTAERLRGHVMHAEWFRLPGATREAVRRTRAAGGRVVAVGTTSARALETVFGGAAGAAKDESREGDTEGWTTLFLRPGHRFAAVDGLLTNFHLPRSSLLALAAALTGRERLLSAYGEAIGHGYRFYSYGDAMLAWNHGRE